MASIDYRQPHPFDGLPDAGVYFGGIVRIGVIEAYMA
jgi:hypothetical protein